MTKVKCIRIAKVHAKDEKGLSTAIKQATEVAQSFTGTLAEAKVHAQKRKAFSPYVDVYVKVQ